MRAKSLALIVSHQLIAWFAAFIIPAFLHVFIEILVGIAGWRSPLNLGLLETDRTPFYPLQIAVCLSAGWLLGSRWRHRQMLGTWLLPLFILACALVVNYETFGAIDVSTRVSTNPFSVFFGWGCASYWTEFPMPCPEQIVTTMPFYAAAAYSLGAFMALRRSPATAVV